MPRDHRLSKFYCLCVSYLFRYMNAVYVFFCIYILLLL